MDVDQKIQTMSDKISKPVLINWNSSLFVPVLIKPKEFSFELTYTLNWRGKDY